MTNLPPTSSGPGASPAPLPPYGADQFYPQEQLPYGYTLATATPPSDKNGPGFAALIIGIVSMVAAFIPFLNFISFLLGPAGIISGIIGLVLTARPRRQAIWGTVLSGVSMIIAFVLVFVYTFGLIFTFFGVISETTRDLPRATDVATVGSEVTGNVVIAIPADDPAGAFWALSSVLAGGAEEPFYFTAK